MFKFIRKILRLFKKPRSRHINIHVKRYAFKRTQGHCFYCGIKVSAKKGHFDHIIPFSRGGSNDYNNIVWACAPCNLSKSDKSIPQWLNTLPRNKARIIRNNIYR